MRVILPLAGLGTRMRPHTWSKPKPLINVAGKTVLDHVLERLEPVDIEELVLIIGYLGDQIREHIESHYDFQTRYIVQEELMGQAHAIHLAKEGVRGPCLIIFVDTIFEADMADLEDEDADAVLYVKEVEDPRRFGVVVEQEGRVVQIIEKPDTFEHRQAVVGVYFVQDGEALIDAIEELIEKGRQTKGEYYLADAFQIMIDRGDKFVTRPVSVWEDCGKPEAVLQTHRYLLDHGNAKEIQTTDSVLIPPVHIADGAQIEQAVVGPYVTVAEGARVTRAVLRDTIVEEGATVTDVVLQSTLIGRNATVRDNGTRLNVGDDADVDLAGRPIPTD